jgi:hypothetical protein
MNSEGIRSYPWHHMINKQGCSMSQAETSWLHAVEDLEQNVAWHNFSDELKKSGR